MCESIPFYYCFCHFDFVVVTNINRMVVVVVGLPCSVVASVDATSQKAGHILFYFFCFVLTYILSLCLSGVIISYLF